MIKSAVKVLKDEERQIVAGEIYEVWLEHEWEAPKLCMPIIKIATSNNFPNWEVFIDERIHTIYETQIFTRGKSTRPQKFVFPKIQRANSALFIHDIVKVQPMSMPKSTLFYLDYKYNDKS